MATVDPNPNSQPTLWNFNPLANTANNIDYGDDTTDYGSTTQPYGGYSTPTSTANWRNPTAWANSLVVGSYQEYYGGPSYVPLNAAPTQWFANAAPDNEAGVYDPTSGAYADLYNYDNVNPSTFTTYSNPNSDYSESTLTYSGVNSTDQPYDSSTREYDGMNNDQSFYSWKNATAWTVISGNRSQ